MLPSIRNAMSELQKELSQGGSLSIPSEANPTPTLAIPVEYARKSAIDYTEIGDEKYPLASLYDYMPEFDPDWATNYQKIVDGYHAFDVNGVPTKAYEYKEPLRLLFKFDLTFYVKSPLHRYAVMDYMIKKYGSRGSVILNKTILPSTEVLGDPVGYNVLPTENVRTDGIIEMNYEFSVKAFVSVADPAEVDLIANFVLTQTNTNI